MQFSPRFFTLACTLAALLCGATPAQAEKLTLMAGGTSKIVYLPLILASQLGYFKDEGLEFEILSQPAGVDTATELLAGAIQGAVGFYDHTIDLQSRGKDVEALMVFSKSAGLVELVSRKSAAGFNTMADAKGKTLGVTGLGSSTNFLTHYLAARAGLSPKEYSVLPVGSDDSFISALNQGGIDAGMIEEPVASRLLASGDAKVLVDMRSAAGTAAALGGPYAGPCFYAQRSWVNTHHDEAQKLVRAMVRSLAFIASHSAEEIAAKVPADFYGPGQGKALYISALKSSMPMFTKDGRMPDGTPAAVLKVLTLANSSIDPRHIDLSRTYTNEFVDRVQLGAK
ncbi:ABC transporter substrate-binding protein [Caballeronia sordidicola]|jgi:NitT/TauT family transport system substrate-binding protein|uniref:ABC-type nitrate/sulfonate/bicarbonate transport system periplasmic component n=1 Tax=Caballeronia sordidicola TaxID=196367 RepID=A0A226X5E0_CABSO|nr:ABC transporter substrate-binding protein [Caballeronia sordidicola]OXC78666.1 ABC-type nitrate/sulfonate/bicarbonate transport system periplasmic component [Caballeronia sordidicola]